ncbi:SET and MYND domain-containing protein 4 [Leguminivora glycinivorella]|uniref:SET and MYND domain-containing protein 4 n=1 Tax=Leguminivora glycinivorella TaxID=1035111 RepID=UPI0020105925|nr:SET and MYND domain-containing protein 4 [Leguminivora glycinivorella]
MSRCPQPDAAYAAACSEQTLCSAARGFLRALLPELAAIPTPEWLSGLEPLNDAGRLQACRDHNELMEAVREVVSRVAPVYRGKDARLSREKRRAAELELKEDDEDAIERALAMASEAVLKAPTTDDDEEATLALALWTRSAILLAHPRRKGTAALADLRLALRSRLPAKMRAHYYWRTGHCYRDCGEPTRAKVSYELALRLLRADDNTSRERLQKDLDSLDFSQQAPESAAKVPEINLVGGCKPNMPALSKHVKIVEEEGKGRFAAARAPLHPGDVVLAESPYAACLLPDHLGTHCLHCFTRLSLCVEEAPVWCPRCAGVAFCSLSCREKGMVYHEHECTFQDLFIGSGMSILSHIALRMVTQLGLPGTLDVYTRHVSGDVPLAHDDIDGKKSKMKSRKERLNRSKKGLKMVEEEKCENEDNLELKTAQIYSLCTHSEQRPGEDYVKRMVVAVFLTECLVKSGFFSSVAADDLENARWSVTAVIIRNLQLLQFNAHEVFETLRSGDGTGEGHLFRGARAQHIAVAIYPTGALFNHDCFPAVARYFIGRRLILTCTRPLPPEAPVSECYGPAAALRPVTSRRRALAARYWFTCSCAACERPSAWPTMHEGGDPPLRCPTPECSGMLSGCRQTVKQGARCSTCGVTFDAATLEKRIDAIEDCHKLFQEGAKLMDDQQVSEAKSVLCEALDRYHEFAAAPRRPAYLAHEALRALLTSAGNSHLVKVKDEKAEQN